ncbi:MAG: N-acetyltransferase [Ignavibacteriae bacterium]|nr:N-acetyltransferase [Ignavibacteriota bacterium]MCB9216653.1 N-acetyltransferase [Ignavibacteria bacterium]
MDGQDSLRIRLALPDDAEKMLAIYAPVVENTGISFEEHLPEVRSFRGRIEQTLEKLPWLVAEKEGRIAGYAYAVPHRVRAAYAWSAEATVYVGANYRQQGIASALYQKLISILRYQGYRNVYALITVPNPASVALHSGAGFSEIGVHRHAGYKLGRWHDVLWMERDLFEGREIDEYTPLPQSLPKLLAAGELPGIGGE